MSRWQSVADEQNLTGCHPHRPRVVLSPFSLNITEKKGLFSETAVKCDRIPLWAYLFGHRKSDIGRHLLGRIGRSGGFWGGF